MSTDNQPQAEPEIGPPITDTPAAPETPAEKAAAETKRTRSTWPIRIGRVVDGGIFPIKGGPEFNEARAAEAWMRANVKPDEMLIPLRVPERPFKATMVLEEVAAPW